VVRYCPACAAALPGPPPVTCPGCGYAQFVNPRPTGLSIILDGDRVLLLRRARDPEAGRWALPGGFCDGWEAPADAAVREAREELGVGIALTRFVGMYLGSYPYQGERLPVLDCFWTARIIDGEPHPDPAEATGLRWVPLAEVPPLAFPSMDSAMKELRAHV
jgi:8-oxo-dGTP diphosphatase